jgi:hypothetical protein
MGRLQDLILLTLAAVVATAGLAGEARAASGLPPFHVTYEGRYFYGTYNGEYVEEGSFVATGASRGSDGPLALRFLSLAGGRTNLANSCEGGGEHTTQAIAGSLNPVAGDWFVDESAAYPRSGWKYSIPGYPTRAPLLETIQCSGSSSRELEEAVHNFLRQGCPAQPAAKHSECEALFEPLRFRPGHPVSRTRSFAYGGDSYLERMTLTVSVTKTAPGNGVGQPHAHGHGSPPTPRHEKQVSERRRRQMKDQARADLRPAIESAWQARGLSEVVEVGVAAGLQSVARDLGRTATLLDGNDAGVRVIEDYRIVEDPPAGGFRSLAEPGPPRAPALPQCAGLAAEAAEFCERLRPAAAAWLEQSAEVAAVGRAMSTTVNRDTAAIDAHAYGAAAAQAAHFASLRARFERALREQGRDGAVVAELLRGAGTTGSLTRAQSASAIGWLRRTLSKKGVSLSRLSELAGAALRPRAVDALDALAHP